MPSADKFGNGVMAAAAFLGGFGCAFGMGWLIALVMCSILPFMGVGAALMGKAVQEIQNESQSWYAKASAVVEECLHAMRTLVAEWIHFTLFWRILPTKKLKVYAFGGL